MRIVRHGCCKQINTATISQFQFFAQFLDGSREIPDRQVGQLHFCQQIPEPLFAEVATPYDTEATSREVLYQLIGGEQVAESMQFLYLIYTTEGILHPAFSIEALGSYR